MVSRTVIKADSLADLIDYIPQGQDVTLEKPHETGI